MTSSPHIWQERFRVRAYEVDPRGFASIQTLCNYFQEAADNQTQTLGLAVDQLAGQGRTWVLSRLRICMEAYPRWRDGILMTTWPSDAGRILAFRDYEFADEAGRRLGGASSAWLLLDLKTRRPVRIPPDVVELSVRDRPRAIAHAFDERLRAPESPENERRFTVRISDLDVNQHVNLVNYIEWAVETVPAAVREQTMLCDLQVEFLAESVYGDEAVSRSQELAPRIFQHAILRKSDLRPLALARTQWR